MSVSIDQALTEEAQRYRPLGMIADKLFPVFPVAKEADLFYQFTRADHGLLANLVSYQTDEFAWSVQDAGQLSHFHRALDMIWLDYEIRVAQIMSRLQQSSPAQTFHFVAGGDVDRDRMGMMALLRHLKDVMSEPPGLAPNVLVVPQNMELFVEPYSPLEGMAVLLPAVMDVNGVGPLWRNQIILAYVNPSAFLDMPTLGKTLRARDWQVKTYHETQFVDGHFVEIPDKLVIEPSVVQTEVLVAPMYATFVTVENYYKTLW